jgi:hypothetical protein
MEIITVNSINLAAVAVAFPSSHESPSIVMCNMQPKAYILSHKNYTMVAPNVMPPIYFHENYNRYKEHNSAIL